MSAEYKTMKDLTYQEIYNLTEKGRLMHEKAVHDAFASLFKKTGHFFRKVLHMEVSGGSNHSRASL